MGNTQSRVQPSLQAATTGEVLIASLPAAVASSANHTCLALGSASLSLSISGLTAKAYIAIANGSPWVVPSLESISPPPTIKSLIGAWYVLLSMVDIAGHITRMLWRAACLFMTLKAFEASTSFRLSAFFFCGFYFHGSRSVCENRENLHPAKVFHYTVSSEAQVLILKLVTELVCTVDLQCSMYTIF